MDNTPADVPPTQGPTWPPPPAGAQPGNYVPPPYEVPLISDFKPVIGLRMPIIVSLIITAILEVVRTLTQGVDPLIFAIDALLAFAMFVVTTILFFTWTYRAYRDLLAITIGETRFTPGWAIAFFFIPILSLYRPVEIFEEIWRRSEPYPLPDARNAPSTVRLWWLSYILMSGTVNIIFRWYDDINSPVPLGLAVANVVLTIVGAALGCVVIDKLSKRIHARYNGLLAALNGVPPMQPLP